MTTKRILLIVLITGLVLVSVVGISEAQGPGSGRGSHRHGNGNNGGFGNSNGNGYGGNSNANGCSGAMSCGLELNNMPAATEGELSDEIIAAMTAGIMDEYNAYATYQAVIDQFGEVRPFTNIQAAEARHIAAWEFIFNRYGIAIPEAPVLNPVPEFANLTEACEIARDAELANIALYDQWLVTVAEYPDIAKVVMSLRNASQDSHLPAFERCAP